MAAPTPVSALVHSSTLVTAGLYLIIRLKVYFPSFIKRLIAGLGLSTLFLGSLRAVMKNDRKKIVAYSTLRKLGLMGVSLSFGLVGLRFFHLLAHGVSKALLFISVGRIMNKENHIQDLRKFGKIKKKNKLN